MTYVADFGFVTFYALTQKEAFTKSDNWTANIKY